MVADNMEPAGQVESTADSVWAPLPANMDFEAADVRWFAGMAMQAIIGRQGVPTSAPLREEIALWSFRMAEAMVKADEMRTGMDTAEKTACKEPV